MHKIPLTNNPNQTFRVTVPLGDENKDVTVRLNFNEEANYWLMSLSDSVTEQSIFVNLPLLSSRYYYCNMITQLDYMNIGSIYIIPIELSNNSAPDSFDLGTKYIMVWGENEMKVYYG